MTEISVRRKVEFSETDMAGLVHFSNFFKYVEYAESALFSKMNCALINTSSDGASGWPRSKIDCSFKSPLRFQDEIIITLSIQELKQKSIVYTFKIHKLENDDKTLAAKGSMTTVYVKKFNNNDKLEPLDLPKEITSLKTNS